MAYIRRKIIKGNSYLYEQHTYREEGKVKTSHIRYIGREGDSNNYSKLGTTENLNNSLINKAEELFGITDNYLEAGYILPNGKLLDFSGRYNATGYKNKKPTNGDYLVNSRNADHREVQQIVKSEHADAITEFVNKTNALRFSAFKNTIQISIEDKNKLTNSQKIQIMKAKKFVNADNIYYDIYDGKGNIIKSGETKNISNL